MGFSILAFPALPPVRRLILSAGTLQCSRQRLVLKLWHEAQGMKLCGYGEPGAWPVKNIDSNTKLFNDDTDEGAGAEPV